VNSYEAVKFSLDVRGRKSPLTVNFNFGRKNLEQNKNTSITTWVSTIHIPDTINYDYIFHVTPSPHSQKPVFKIANPTKKSTWSILDLYFCCICTTTGTLQIKFNFGHESRAKPVFTLQKKKDWR
jgi:hypothetical protein